MARWLRLAARHSRSDSPRWVIAFIATAPDPEPNGAVEKRGFVAGPFEVAEPWALFLSVRD